MPTPMMTVLIIIGSLITLTVIYIIIAYNTFVTLRNKVEDQWSQIDVELKRRFDLIPNLVNVVKGYAKHEKNTFESVVKARNTYLGASSNTEKIEASNELSNVMNKLFALAESYPELKANENFKELQIELKNTEDKIGFARKFYNDVVLKFNNKISTFPNNLIAKFFGFKKYDYFKASETERENLKVDFN